MASFKGTAGDDTLRGGNDQDSLYGYAGDDVLDGGASHDWLYGGLGADQLIGGDGSDSAVYWHSDAGVVVNLATGIGSGGEAEGDTLSGIERVFGSNYNDIVIGDAGDNYFQGESGDDIFDGGDGNDSCHGGYGNDRMFGGAGNDRFEGDDGADYLDGGDGDDLLDGGQGADQLIGGAGNDTASYSTSGEAVTVRLTTGFGLGGCAQGDRLSGIENLTGSYNNDSLFGDTGANVLEGRTGNDVLDGGAGDDVLYGDISVYNYDHRPDGNDIMFGGSGNDLLFGGFGNDLLEGGAGNDMLYGNNLGEVDSGYDDWRPKDDNDVLAGGDGNDMLFGGAGNDVLDGGNGENYLDGGSGFDLVDYSHKTEGLFIELSTGESVVSGSDFTDTLSNIEGVIGSAASDLIIGSDGANVLAGGGAGDDLIGGAGADIFRYHDVKDSSAVGGLTLSGGEIDWILDFSQADGDKIDLAAINGATGNQLHWSNSATAFGVWAVNDAAEGWGAFVCVDADGDTQADMAICVGNLPATALGNNDFLF